MDIVTKVKEPLKAEDFYISALSIKGNKILNDIELSFKGGNKVFNTIIFAGNNGCGKTTVLSIIEECIKLLTFSFNHIEEKDKKTGSLRQLSAMQFDDDKSESNFFLSQNYPRLHFMNGIITIALEDCNNNFFTFCFNFDSQRKVVIKLNDKEITNINANIFAYKHLQFELPTRLKRESQIKSDIKNLYSAESSNVVSTLMLNNENVDKSNVKEFKSFKFGHFLQKNFNMALSLQPQGDSIQINKVKNNPYDIETLCSGEKEIIYRSFCFFNRNNELPSPKFAFIDEPEPNLHPLWQRNILDCYRSILNSRENAPQIFVATHSDHILHSALQDNDTLIIKLSDVQPQYYHKDGNGIICPTITIGEIKWSIFNIATVDFHITLYGYVAEKASMPHGINGCDDFIRTTQAYNKDKNVFETNFIRFNNYKNATNTTETLPTYMRNTIHHSSPNRTLHKTNEEFEKALMLSIQLLIDIIKEKNW